MKNRIQQLIKEQGLSNSQFADKVGIPRSGLSHVLSGRNKPSLDYVIKILEAFPDLDAEWFLKGKIVDAPHQNINTGIENVNKKLSEQAESLAQNLKLQDGKKESENRVSSFSKTISNSSEFSKKEIERVIIFYRDGSMKEYLP